MGRSWFLRDGLSYFVSKLVPGVFGLVAVAVFVRSMGLEEYGRYALAFTVANAASLFSMGWLGQAVLRYRSRLLDDEATRIAVRVGLSLSLAVGGIGLFAVLSSGVFGDSYSPVGLAATLLLFAALSVWLVRSALLQADLRPHAVAVMSSVQAILGVTLPVILFFGVGPTHAVAVAGLSVSYLVPALWGGGWLLRPSSSAEQLARGLASFRAARPLLSEFWRYGRALSLWMAVTALLQVSDRHFIQTSWGFGAAGDYAATYDLVFRGFTLALSPITLAIHPRMMMHWNANQESEAWSIWRTAIIVQIGVFLLVLVPAYWLREVVVWIVGAGDKVRDLVLPLLVGGFVWQLCLLAHKPLELASRTSSMLFAAFVALSVNLAVNIFLVPSYGPMASAYGTVASGLLYIVTVLAFGARAHSRTANA